MKKSKPHKTEFYNKKARFDFDIIESFEAGLVLNGLEIKEIRNGRVNMTGSYVKILNDEVFWLGGIINVTAGDIQRTRKLLLHKEQIEKLFGKTQEKGLTLIPLKLYLTRGRAKMEVGLGKGMKKYEKRDVLKRRDIDREISSKIRESVK